MNFTTQNMLPQSEEDLKAILFPFCGTFLALVLFSILKLILTPRPKLRRKINIRKLFRSEANRLLKSIEVVDIACAKQHETINPSEDDDRAVVYYMDGFTRIELDGPECDHVAFNNSKNHSAGESCTSQAVYVRLEKDGSFKYFCSHHRIADNDAVFYSRKHKVPVPINLLK